MSETPENGKILDRRSQLKTLLNELTKSFIEYDGQGRMFKVYQARTDAVDGEDCLVTIYNYVSPSSTQIKNFKEDIAQWDAATMEVVP